MARGRGQRWRLGRGKSTSEELAGHSDAEVKLSSSSLAPPLSTLEALSLISLGEYAVAQESEAETDEAHDFEEIIGDAIPNFRAAREAYLRSTAEYAYAAQALVPFSHGLKSGHDKGKDKEKGKEDKERERQLRLRLLTTLESTVLLTRLLNEPEPARDEPCSALRRLLVRKLKLEKHRRTHGLPSSSYPDLPHEKRTPARILHAPEQLEPGSGSGLGAMQKQQPDPAVLDSLYAIRTTPYAHSFAARLAGCAPRHACAVRLRQTQARAKARVDAKGIAAGEGATPKLDDSGKHMEANASVLNEGAAVLASAAGSDLMLEGGFLHRDWSARTPWLDLMDDIYAHYALAHPDYELPERIPAPIDYEPLRAEHLPQVHDLLERVFWPGINVNDSLQYSPEKCTVVATYRRHLVVGAAFLSSPQETYITYLAVRAGWDSSQIATKMLYFLIARNPQNDIILHVSANNPAMLLYNRFGFKAEEFIVGFYEDYLDPQSRASKNAYRLRLRR